MLIICLKSFKKSMKDIFEYFFISINLYYPQ